jgi:hypothetical protein
MNAIRINAVTATGGGPLDDQIIYMVDSDDVFRFHTPGRVHTYVRIQGRDKVVYQGVEAWLDESSENGDQWSIASSSVFPTITSASFTNQRPLIRTHLLNSLMSLFKLRSSMG